jgi:aldehyde:ferredoxin oxidoreductase
MGFCKLPWNDVVPADNSTTAEPAKIPEHVQNYLALFTATTGIQIDVETMLMQSARVYNFQRIFNIRMGKGLRANDIPPYRAVGPVTREEYESRAERYDKQMLEEIGVDPAGKSMEEKMAVTRKYRMDRYGKLCDAVYSRRGWTPDGVPTMARLKELGLDVLPDVVAIVQAHGG